MNGFRTSRALIIDDEIGEAMPVVRALGLLGISSIYHDAHPSRDYSTQHAGVRLLVLDMILAERVSDQGDPKNVAAGLIGALKQILDPSPGIVVIVCWTKHKDNVEEFQKAFRVEFPNIQVADVLIYEKKNLEDPATIAELVERIRAALSLFEPSTLLVGWEQLVHEAATKTTSSICELAAHYAAKEKKQWSEGAFAVCAALALAERGSRLIKEKPHISLHGLNDALGPLLLDRVEHSLPKVPDAVAEKLLQFAKKEVELWDTSKSLLEDDLRATLNAQVNISYNVVAGEVSPGNVYLELQGNDNRKLSNQFFNDWDGVISDTLIPKASEKLPRDLPFVFVEITPPCDFAQGKSKLPRFIAGILVSEPTAFTIRKGAYIRSLGIFKINGDISGVFSLILNGHYIVSLPLTIARQLKPILRLRSAITADVVAWLGAQMTRPGYVQLVPVAANQQQRPEAVEAPAPKEETKAE